MHRNEINLIRETSTIAIVVYRNQSVICINLAQPLDSIRDVIYVSVSVPKRFFGYIPNQIGVSLISPSHIVEIAIVRFGISLGSRDTLIPYINHQVGNDVLLVQVINDAVKPLEEVNIQVAKVGIGIRTQKWKSTRAIEVILGI